MIIKAHKILIITKKSKIWKIMKIPGNLQNVFNSPCLFKMKIRIKIIKLAKNKLISIRIIANQNKMNLIRRKFKIIFKANGKSYL